MSVDKKYAGLRPLFDRVVVKTEEPEKVTKSGIIIPDTADKEKPVMGVVVAVGMAVLTETAQKEK